MSTPPLGDPKAYSWGIAPLPPEEGGGFVVSFPDIPGCLGVGDTEEEAIDDGQKALFAALDAFSRLLKLDFRTALTHDIWTGCMSPTQDAAKGLTRTWPFSTTC